MALRAAKPMTSGSTPKDAIMQRNRRRLESQGLEGELLTDQLKALRSQARFFRD